MTLQQFYADLRTRLERACSGAESEWLQKDQVKKVIGALEQSGALARRLQQMEDA